MTDLNALLERVKLATGDDPHENYEINIEIGKALLGWYLHEHKAFGGYDTDWAEWRTPDEQQVRPMPDFVKSIDASVVLAERVLPGCFYSVARHVGLMKRKRKDKTVTPFEAYVANHDRIGEPGYVFALSDPAPTPALALIAATLAALIAGEAK